MYKTIVSLCIILIISILIPAQAENGYIVNDHRLQDMSIEELYDLEDAIILALNDVFSLTSDESSDGELIAMYVVNPRTKKFHYPYCYSALQIGEDRLFEYCTASELVEKKYKPCGQCKPYADDQDYALLGN